MKDLRDFKRNTVYCYTCYTLYNDLMGCRRLGKDEIKEGWTWRCCFMECMLCCEGNMEPPMYRHCFDCDYGWNRKWQKISYECWDEYHKRTKKVEPERPSAE
jgi:hypothetical protein